MRAMWRCPGCSRSFANRHQPHACASHSLDAHFTGKSSRIREIYDAFVALLGTIGPVIVLPEKTRIAFQVRMSFAQLTPRQRWVDGHVVLARRLEHPRFRAIQTLSARNHVHFFRLTTPEEVNGEVKEWLQEAYAVGEQRHLKRERR